MDTLHLPNARHETIGQRSKGGEGKREAANSMELPVKPVVTADARRVALNRSNVSLESQISKKRRSREHECKLCSTGTFISTPVRRFGITCLGSWLPTRPVGHVRDSMGPAAN